MNDQHDLDFGGQMLSAPVVPYWFAADPPQLEIKANLSELVTPLAVALRTVRFEFDACDGLVPSGTELPGSMLYRDDHDDLIEKAEIALIRSLDWNWERIWPVSRLLGDYGIPLLTPVWVTMLYHEDSAGVHEYGLTCHRRFGASDVRIQRQIAEMVTNLRVDRAVTTRAVIGDGDKSTPSPAAEHPDRTSAITIQN